MTATARTYLVQQLGRLQLAVKDITGQFERIEAKLKEVQCDLILVIAAIDDLEDQSKKDAA